MVEQKNFHCVGKKIRTQSKGVSQKDLTLIAYAKRNNKTVVTFEKKQVQKPKEKYKFKIPLVCKDQNVECIDFVEMIKELGLIV